MADSLAKNRKVTLEITDVTENGDGIGRAPDGKVVFVFMALPGETVDALIIKVTKSYYVGKLISVHPDTTANTRTTSPCPSFPKCGGCTLLHVTYEGQLQIKEKHVRDCIERIGKISQSEYEFEEIVPSPTTHYRNKTIYQLQDGKCGFFRRNSHDIIEANGCIVESETALNIRDAFMQIAFGFGLTMYDEQTGKGLLRNLFVRIGANGAAMVVIVINGDTLPNGIQIAEQLYQMCPETESIYLNINNSRTNTILGEKYILIFGLPQIQCNIGRARFLVSPQSFLQVNPSQTEKLYSLAYEYADLREGDVLLDIYCGIGTIGLYMASRCKADGIDLAGILGIEYTKQAIIDARKNAGLNDFPAKALYIDGDSGNILTKITSYLGERTNFREENTIGEAADLIESGPNVVVIDPPRKGVSQDVIDAIGVLSPDRIVYVSCDPATLARDIALFGEYSYKLVKARPVDMFPNSGHVETVVLLSRA